MNKHSLSTSNFKKNIIFILKLLLALSLVIGYIYHVLPQYEKGYDASLIDKVDRLNSIDEPKIVLIGNSNLAFGINSELIEEEIGMPVVNMGLHGGAGNAFHEEMSKYNVTPGDIYIICHSEYDDNNEIGDTMTAWTSIENHFNLWRILRKEDAKTMAKAFPVYLKKSLNLYSSGTGNQDPGGIYARSAFNEYGDVAVLREGSVYATEETVDVPEIGKLTTERINELYEYLTERGAYLLVAGFPIGNGSVTADVKEYVDFQQTLTDELDCPVISNYVDYMLDYSYFYDYNYLHLNSEGADIRTYQLISDIRRWQDTGEDADFNNDEYMDIIADTNLSHINNIYDYLDSLDNSKNRYTIIISVKDDAAISMNPDIIRGLSSLGLSCDWSDGYGCGYVAVIEQGMVVYDILEHERIEISGNFDNCKMTYDITSAGWDRGSYSSILLNGREYSQNLKGLNFVVYSNETHRILDEVTFDTCTPELTVTR